MPTACLPDLAAASSSECAPLFFLLYRPFEVDTGQTDTHSKDGKRRIYERKRRGEGAGAGAGNSHFPAACEGSPNLMMCGQWSRALLKKGLVTPSIIAGLSSR